MKPLIDDTCKKSISSGVFGFNTRATLPYVDGINCSSKELILVSSVYILASMATIMFHTGLVVLEVDNSIEMSVGPLVTPHITPLALL